MYAFIILNAGREGKAQGFPFRICPGTAPVVYCTGTGRRGSVLDFKSARHWAQELIAEVLFEGAVAVDETR